MVVADESPRIFAKDDWFRAPGAGPNSLIFSTASTATTGGASSSTTSGSPTVYNTSGIFHHPYNPYPSPPAVLPFCGSPLPDMRRAPGDIPSASIPGSTATILPPLSGSDLLGASGAEAAAGTGGGETSKGGG